MTLLKYIQQYVLSAAAASHKRRSSAHDGTLSPGICTTCISYDSSLIWRFKLFQHLVLYGFREVCFLCTFKYYMDALNVIHYFVVAIQLDEHIWRWRYTQLLGARRADFRGCYTSEGRSCCPPLYTQDSKSHIRWNQFKHRTMEKNNFIIPSSISTFQFEI